MFSRQHAATGWPANGTAGVMLGEAHSVFSHLIESRSFDDLLPVATEITIAEVIGKDVDDVRFIGSLADEYEAEGKKNGEFHDRELIF